MGSQSKIEWTNRPSIRGSAARKSRVQGVRLRLSYAEKWAKRSGQVEWGNHPRRRTTEVYWRNPFAWNSRARLFQTEHGRRQRVFCASLADVFDNQVDPAWRADLFNLIRECDQLDWQLLTKRPQNIRKMLPARLGRRISERLAGDDNGRRKRLQAASSVLLKVPAVIHFVSYEPAIGPLGQLDIDGRSPDWVIIGGESGVRSDLTRPTDPQWARDAIAECRRVGAAPFLKQWGAYKNNPCVVEDGLTEQQAIEIDPPENGKGGGKLDGRLWREFPSTSQKTLLPRERGGAEDASEGPRAIYAG